MNRHEVLCPPNRLPVNTVRDPFKIPPIDDDGDACHRLWCSTLALLVYDARSYWKGIKDAGVDFEQAFDDVMRCGPMLRHLCDHTGHNPQWLSRGFVKWCEQNHSV